MHACTLYGKNCYIIVRSASLLHSVQWFFSSFHDCLVAVYVSSDLAQGEREQAVTFSENVHTKIPAYATVYSTAKVTWQKDLIISSATV